MQTDFVTLSDFCASHQIEISFVQSLEEQGLVKTLVVDESLCVSANELPTLERIIRLHHELNINPEGIDVINHLLKRLQDMHHEITQLKNRLDFYVEKDEE